MSELKRLLNEQFALVGKALSNTNRLEIIECLAQSECSVDELAKLSGLSMANVSQHLQQLKLAGFVNTRKEGQRVYYRLSGDEVITVLAAVRAVAERYLAEANRLIESYLTAKDGFEPVPAEELLKRGKKGLVTILDVRPQKEYGAGHLPLAINIPLEKLEEQLSELRKNKEIVAYCRGPYCVLAYNAVGVLRANGFKARRLKEGFPEWKEAGFPIETSTQ